ncbi:MAG: histidinol-phosphate transaminase [Bacteroidaceae bacterium]|nr:histidinol-phosphate transaminase [Bacteroidaceae bacterium]MBQ5694391.1 histidinol-phosphate transaminase [Bacteroidaceae bacterium]MBQ5839169.1 histidinol-phosphate transaminase [Bacteroidaceae bacterium]MBQ5912392.1 histidinol-phosphate transaminase [Bacteroidaceae bacterium]
MFMLESLVRKNILALKPYSCARDEFKGRDAHVFLDANESAYNSPFNRYPDPLQEQLKQTISQIKGVPTENIFLGNGSDEAIDLVYRIFCEPRMDNVVAIDPTYGMYKVCADINDVEYRPVLLSPNYALSADALLQACDEHTKVIWICTPNNPTGNDMDRGELQKILTTFKGIVVIDEAYGDFSDLKPMRSFLKYFPRMIVLNTFSKAWASAAIRLGMAFASEEIIALFNKVKYPYNVNMLTQQAAQELLSQMVRLDRWTNEVRHERAQMIPCLMELPIVKQVYQSSANFLLVRVTDADAIYAYLVDNGIIVRNRNRVTMCQNALRITIGSKEENNELLGALRRYKQK